MMKWRILCMGLVVVVAVAPRLSAQFPAPPAPPAPAVPGVPAGAPAPKNIFSFFGITKDNLAACKAKFCASQLGLLFNNGMKPFSALTGGILPSCCPKGPSQADL